MPIDWFTVIAQALNFGALVWLLKHFLYGPILQAVDAREKRVADELADAAAQKAQAQQESDALARKNAAFAQERKALLEKAQTEAAQQRQQLLAQAHEDAQAWTAKRQATLVEQAKQVDGIIRSQVQQEVFAIARKALQELASADLEQRICETFVGRLRESDSAARTAMANAWKSDPEAILVRSAFVLTEPMRSTITSAVGELLGSDASLQFDPAPGLGCGIELVGGGQKLGWSISDYLDAMERRLAQRLRETAETVNTAATPAAATP